MIMNDVFIIYHVKDGSFWFLNDLDSFHKSLHWSRWCPYCFYDFEVVNRVADKIRLAMPDYNVFVCTLSLLPEFIKRNSEVEF